jgi:hypothetical protein
MWIIDLNIAGLHFTREMPDLLRRPMWLNPHSLYRPVLQQPKHAA